MTTKFEKAKGFKEFNGLQRVDLHVQYNQNYLQGRPYFNPQNKTKTIPYVQSIILIVGN